jgi:hypothetical protein
MQYPTFSISKMGKNLVCTHCINMLQTELKNLGLEYKEIGLGLMEINEENNLAKQFREAQGCDGQRNSAFRYLWLG